MPIAIEFHQVSRHYGEVKALDRVSFQVEEGEFFSMLGPSGSGKTTSLRLMAGFEQPNSGSLALFGREASGPPPFPVICPLCSFLPPALLLTLLTFLLA